MNATDPLAALADIELPAPPDWRPLIALAALLLLAALAGIFYLWHRRRHPTPAAPARAEAAAPPPECEARARLARLWQEWAAGAIDARAAAYRLGTLLRLGLELPQLHPAAPPAGLDPHEWRETLTLLQGLRYAPAPPQALTPEIFARAQRWLDSRSGAEEARDV